MRVYRYPGRALAGDYLRAAMGFCIGLGVILFVAPSPAIILIFGGLACLFGFYGFRTVQRQLTRVAVSDAEIRDTGFGTRVMAWGDLQRIKLRYFGTRRQKRERGGYMQLTLKGVGTSLTYDSGLEGFDYLAWRAAKALRENGRDIDPTSAGNLLTLGLDADGEMPPPDAAGARDW
ncbi:MAG: hypothetical protein V3T57_06180 [Kiloniellales bacterium]|jgi:hypothetical protein